MATAVALVVLAASCTGPAGPGGRSAGSTPSAPGHRGARPTTTTTGLPIVPVQWTACGGLQCGSVAVPLNYDEPTGPTLQIAVALSLIHI